MEIGYCAAITCISLPVPSLAFKSNINFPGYDKTLDVLYIEILNHARLIGLHSCVKLTRVSFLLWTAFLRHLKDCLIGSRAIVHASNLTKKTLALMSHAL